jgi:hypothetical protein
MEIVIHGVFVVTAAQVWNCGLDAMTTQARLASEQGDLRAGVDPYTVSESIINAMPGAQLLSKTADADDHIKRLTRSLGLLLPAIVAGTSLAHFREFLDRESPRHHQAIGSTD